MIDTNRTQLLYSIARRVALVTTCFAVLLSVLLVVNYAQTKSVDPLNSQAINSLMEGLKDNPNDDALKEQIRALDLLARKAYFTNQWQVRAGGMLLFIFVLTMLLSMKYMSSLQASLPDLTADPKFGDRWDIKLLSRKSVIYSGAGLFVMAFVLGVVAEEDLSSIGFTDATTDTAASAFPGIEEIRDNWPNFRGPEGIGVAYHTDVPAQWDGASGENILWKVAVPMPGFNSPVIWDKKLFLSGADRDAQFVYCHDADTGEMLWQCEIKDVSGSPADKPRVSEDTGLAAPTMATDGTHVFVMFGTGDVACLDYDGNQVWAKNLGVPDNHYGHSSSLITYQDLLLIQFDHFEGGHLIALATLTGAQVYDSPRDTEISWASPIVVNTGSRDEVILNSVPDVISHDPRTGRELWRIECMLGEVAPSLAYGDGAVYAVNEYARLAAISLEGTPSMRWESEDDLSEVSSPVAANGMVFVATSYGTVSCFDGQTGERYWYQDFTDGFYSSPVLAGDNIYVIDMTGVMKIFKADKEYTEVNSCELGEGAVTTPAFMHNRIYIRGMENLYCIGE